MCENFKFISDFPLRLRGTEGVTLIITPLTPLNLRGEFFVLK